MQVGFTAVGAAIGAVGLYWGIQNLVSEDSSAQKDFNNLNDLELSDDEDFISEIDLKASQLYVRTQGDFADLNKRSAEITSRALTFLVPLTLQYFSNLVRNEVDLTECSQEEVKCRIAACYKKNFNESFCSTLTKDLIIAIDTVYFIPRYSLHLKNTIGEGFGIFGLSAICSFIFWKSVSRAPLETDPTLFTCLETMEGEEIVSLLEKERKIPKISDLKQKIANLEDKSPPNLSDNNPFLEFDVAYGTRIAEIAKPLFVRFFNLSTKKEHL